MQQHDIIVIGSSAGGVKALKTLVKSFSINIEASIFVVQHVSPHAQSLLPEILTSAGPLKAAHAVDGEIIEKAKIYIAPPDHHMIISEGRILVKKGPRENRFRPSIDALMRSAAYEYGERVIGIVLTGMLDDGTSGLWSVNRLGGITIIQNPEDALYPDMPRNVLEFVDVSYNVPLSEIGMIVNDLVRQPVPVSNPVDIEILCKMETEIKVAAQQNALANGILELGEKTSMTCPECGGAMTGFTEGKAVRFRCHTGHGFTSGFLLAEILETVESKLWQSLRSMEEAIILLEQSADQYRKSLDDIHAQHTGLKAARIRNRAVKLLDFIYEEGQLEDLDTD